MKNATAALAIIAFLLGGCLQFGQPAGTNKVEITSQGFVPNTIRVSAGDTVTFTNMDAVPHWPAADEHPTHGNYPQGGGCIGSAFDACQGLKTGESFSFTFHARGIWKYHDHLNSGMIGTVIVG